MDELNSKGRSALFVVSLRSNTIKIKVVIYDYPGLYENQYNILINFSQAIWHDNAKAVDALLKNGAKIDENAKGKARGNKYEKIVSDDVVRRVGISDSNNITVFTTKLLVPLTFFISLYTTYSIQDNISKLQSRIKLASGAEEVVNIMKEVPEHCTLYRQELELWQHFSGILNISIPKLITEL